MTKQLRGSYLYADGHAVLIWEKQDKDAGEVQWAELHEKWTDARLDFKGRICFSPYGGQALIKMAKRAVSVRATAATVDRGSDRTRELALAVGDLSFDFGDNDYLHLTSIPGLISCQWTYQPETTDDWTISSGLIRWGSLPIGKVVRAKAAMVPA